MNDFLKPQPTNTEKLIQGMYLELSGNLKNLSRQLRTLALLAKVKPEKFVETFNDQIAHDVFFKNLLLEEAKFAEEQKKKDETLKELNANTTTEASV